MVFVIFIFILYKLLNNTAASTFDFRLKNGERRSCNLEGEIHNAFNGMLNDDAFFFIMCSAILSFFGNIENNPYLRATKLCFLFSIF